MSLHEHTLFGMTDKVQKAIDRMNNDNDEARRMFEICQLKGKHIINPIIDWLTEDV